MLEPLFLQSTTTLVSPSKFYPVDIAIPHNQLRSFISATYQDRLYFAHRYDVFVFDLVTHERSLVVTVPFEARCLAAAHGWICVGGERTGDCAFAYIGEEDGRPGEFCQELQVKRIGKEIVNAISIEILKPDLETQAEEVVVLLSNNDHTVTIYSLARWDVLAIIEHPQPMNNARLSPDSTVLVALGDENKVYFRKRYRIQESLDGDDEDNYPNYGWRLLPTLDLPQGPINVSGDYSFAVAFSPDGSLCAVSSQGGCISIFDMDAIEEEATPTDEAMLCTFRSSRPGLHGLIRSMNFSPGHWGLLAWSEDHKNIGIADVRQAFQRRQHVSLLPETFEKLSMRDIDPQQWLQPDPKIRLSRQNTQRESRRGQPPLGARSLQEHVRAPPSPDPSEPERDAASFANEAMLRALDIHSEQSIAPNLPYSVNYSTTQPRISPSASNRHARREWETQLLNPRTRQPNAPRRRSSVVLSPQPSNSLTLPGDATRMMMTASPGLMSDDGLPPVMSTNDLTPSSTSSSQPLPYNIPPSDPWHVIEADLLARRSALDEMPNPPLSERMSMIIAAEGQLAFMIEAQMGAERELSRRFAERFVLHERTIRQRMNDSSGNIPTLDNSLLQLLRDEREASMHRTEELEVARRAVARRMSQLTTERNEFMARSIPILTAVTLSASHSSAARAENEATIRRFEIATSERESRTQNIIALQVAASSAQDQIDYIEAPYGQSSPRTAIFPPAAPYIPITPTSTSPPSETRRRLDTQDTSILMRRWQPGASDNIGSLRATLPRSSDVVTRAFVARHNARDSNDNWSQPGAGGQHLEHHLSMPEPKFGTAGIAWSPDGMKLFAALEQGIFELDLNVQDRLQVPLIEWR